jgi:hypothetical protein
VGPADRPWRSLGEAAGISDTLTLDGGTLIQLGKDHRFRLGIAAFLSKERGFCLYDPQKGVICSPEACWKFSRMEHLYGLRGLSILRYCTEKGMVRLRKDQYVPGSGEIHTVKTASRRFLVPFDQLYLSEDGKEIWLTDKKEVWRALPGTADLRIWPPQP